MRDDDGTQRPILRKETSMYAVCDRYHRHSMHGCIDSIVDVTALAEGIGCSLRRGA